MLRQKIFVYGVTSQGNGVYSMTPFFADTAIAAYVNVGDQITDTSSKRFLITSIPVVPLQDGGVVIVQALDGAAPTEDSDYNSNIETPGQVDMGSAIKTGGTIITSAVRSAPNYEHRVTASWIISSEALKAQLGDSVMDSAGREFTISGLPNGNVNGEFYVREKEHLGKSPALGSCGLYRPTTNLMAYQGPSVSADANQTIQNRDFKVLDMVLGDNIESRLEIGVSPVELPDGVRTVFTLPSGHKMVPDSLQVYLNGLIETDFSETTDSTFTLEMGWVPGATDEIRLFYVRPSEFDPADL